ncbi:MAG: hypothetical protein FWE57_04895 [Chitinispirillia bacterium]|nr:hypothetical protein [Chitinispirillia bacterium]
MKTKSAFSFKSLVSLMSFLSFASFTLATERQIITAPITVEVGDTLRITSGQELLFIGYTGITVMGRLEAIGTKQQPIIFASVNDTNGTASPFDWNGIEITGTGTAELAYSLITNATSGITAENAHSLTLTECIFKENGQWHLSIAGEPQVIPGGQPYSHKPVPLIIPTATELATPESIHIATVVNKPERDNRRTWFWGLSGAGAVTAIGGGISLYQAHRTAQEYNAYLPSNSKFDAATPEERQKHYDKLRLNHNTAQIIGWSLIGIATADFLYLTFVF